MTSHAFFRLQQGLLLFLLAASVLVTGGKTIPSTWILVGVASVVTLIEYWERMRTKREIKDLETDSVWLTLMAFFGWTVMSYLFSTTQNYGLDEVLQTGALVLVFLWMMHQADRANEFLHRVLTTIVIVTFIAIAVGAVVYIGQPQTRFVGTFFDPRFVTDYWPNAWAEYLLLAWPIVAYKVRNASCLGLSPFACRSVLLGIVFASLFLAYSRGAFIVFIGQIIFLAAVYLYGYYGERNARASEIGRNLVTILVCATFVFFVMNLLRGTTHDVESITRKITFTAAEGTSSVSERSAFWSQAVALTLERPILGWGPYSFRFVQPRLEKSVLQTSDHPHNVFLKYAMERGIPAAILFALVILFLYVRSRNLMNSLFWLEWRKTTESDWLPYVLTSIGGVVAHNLIDYNLQFGGIAVPFWLLLAFTTLLPSLEKTHRIHIVAFLKYRTEIVLACALLIVAIVEGRFLVTSSLGRHYQARGRTTEALLWYAKSHAEMYSRDLHLSVAQLLTQQGDLDGASKALDDYALQNNEDARLWRLRGDIAEQRGDIDHAIDDYEHAYASARFNDLGITRRLTELLLHRDPHDVTFRKRELDEIVHAYADAIKRNSHFIALSSNVEELTSLTALLINQFPSSADTYRTIASEAQRAAAVERSHTLGQPRGMFW
jgi:O-antigen ligase